MTGSDVLLKMHSSKLRRISTSLCRTLTYSPMSASFEVMITLATPGKDTDQTQHTGRERHTHNA